MSMEKFDCTQCNRPHCLRKEFGLPIEDCTHLVNQNNKRESIENQPYYTHCCESCKFMKMETNFGVARCMPLYEGIADTNCGLVKKWIETRKPQKEESA